MTDITAARDIIARYNAAILAKSAANLASLYAEDATHELPFSHRPPLRGPAEIRGFYDKAWANASLKVRGITNLVLHACTDGETFVVEEDIALSNARTGSDFEVATVLVVRIRNGRIAAVRDYTDNMTIATALGRPPSVA